LIAISGQPRGVPDDLRFVFRILVL
jgi:hypothetical protein